MLVHCGMWFIKLKVFIKKILMNFVALAMSKQCFLFSFKITSIMVEWITLTQNVAHLLYILNSYFLKEMYSKFTFYFLLELNLLLIPQSVFF